MGRLATIATTPSSGICRICWMLDHLDATDPETGDELRDLITRGTPSTVIADAVTELATDDGLEFSVTESSVRRHRARHAGRTAA